MTMDDAVARGPELARPIGDALASGATVVISRVPGFAAAVAVALQSDGPDFRIALLDEGNLPLLALGPFDEEEVVAIWRKLAASSGLPLAVLLPNGAVATPFPQLGRLVIGSARGRRRVPILNGRRPRFLVRRKGAKLPSRPLIYREREMAAGRGR